MVVFRISIQFDSKKSKPRDDFPSLQLHRPPIRAIRVFFIFLQDKNSIRPAPSRCKPVVELSIPDFMKKAELLKISSIASPCKGGGIKVPLAKVYRGWRILAGFEMLKSERVAKRGKWEMYLAPDETAIFYVYLCPMRCFCARV